LLALLLAGCSKNPDTTRTNVFFASWLKEHGETNVVVDSAGVGITGNETRLSASLYGTQKAGDGLSAEVEFKIKLPPADQSSNTLPVWVRQRKRRWIKPWKICADHRARHLQSVHESRR